jgi:hypothetical protein
MDSDVALSYLKGRGASDTQIERHRLGFTGGCFELDPCLDPSHGDQCSNDLGFEKCDSCRYQSWSSSWEGDSDGPKRQIVGSRVRDSIVLPLTSYSGQCVGFQVRSIKEKSYDTFTLKRRPEGFFFGTSVAMESIWSSGEVSLVEGPFDHLTHERLISPNVLALCTSSVSQAHIRFLRRFVRRVNLCFDTDAAGRKGVRDFRTHYEQYFSWVRDVQCPQPPNPVKDLNDAWRALGDDRFRAKFLERYG